MTLDDEERAIVARTQLAEQTIGGFVVKMAKRRPACPRQCCSLGDAVVDQRIMHDQIVAAEQMPDDSNVRRMSADERDTIVGAMEARQRLLQLAVKRSLAGNRAAGRDCCAVAVDCRLRRLRDARVPVEADVVIGSEVDVGLVADQGFRAGDAFMDAKERIGDVEKLGGLPNQADLAKPFERRRIEPLGGGIDRLPGGAAQRMSGGASCRSRRQLVD